MAYESFAVITCDVCGYETGTVRKTPFGWWEVSTAWNKYEAEGEDFEVCSLECMAEFARRKLAEGGYGD